MDRDHAKYAINIALEEGAEYVDVRLDSMVSKSIVMEDGAIEKIASNVEHAVGFRVLYNGAWGFYAVDDPDSKEDYILAARNAIKLAKAYSDSLKDKVKLAEVKEYKDTVKFGAKIDPDTNFNQLLEIAKDCNSIIKQYDRIKKVSIMLAYDKVSKIFMNSNGADIKQSYTDTVAVLTSTAYENISQTTNTTVGGRGGIEMLADTRSKADYIASMAAKLIDAKPIKEQKAKVIMNPDFVALLTHEILGHPSEADRVLGYELAWAGGAWWKGRLGEKIASDALNVVDDPTIPNTLGNYKYDDEGIIAKPKVLIKDGVLVDHMYSRETASIFNKEPNASMRSTNARYMPLIRMACTFIKQGDYSYEEMIKEVKDGYLICDMKVPSIDMYRYNWSISCQYAYKIEGGEIKQLHRDVIAMHNSPDFLKSIDACSREFEIKPILNCGKGDPMQIMRMGNGGPYIRAEAIVKSVE